MCGFGFTVGGWRLAVCGSLVAGWWFGFGSASIFRGGANGTHGTYDVACATRLVLNRKLQTANRKPLTANR
jgi:hypothetical protein